MLARCGCKIEWDRNSENRFSDGNPGADRTRISTIIAKAHNLNAMSSAA